MLVKSGNFSGYDVKILGYNKGKVLCLVQYNDCGCENEECNEYNNYRSLPATAFGFRNLREFHEARTRELTTALNAERAAYSIALLKRPTKAKQKEILECIKV